MKINKPMLFNGQHLATYVKLFEKLGLTSNNDASDVSGVISKSWILGTDSKSFTGADVLVTAAGAETISAAIARLTTAVAQVKQYNVVAEAGTALEVTPADATAAGITTTTFTVDLNLADNSLEQSADGLKVKVADKTLVVSESGLASGIKLEKLDETTDGFAASYQLVDAAGTALANSAVINIPKDQFLKAASYVPASEVLRFEFNLADGDSNIVDIPVGELVDEYSAGNGIEISDAVNGKNVVAVKVAEGTKSFVTVDSNGLHLATETALTAASDVKLPTSKAVADYVADYVADQAKGAYSAVVKLEGTLGTTVESAPAVNTLYVDNDGQTGIVLAGQTTVIDISQEFITSLDEDVTASDERLITAGAVKAVKTELEGEINIAKGSADNAQGTADNAQVAAEAAQDAADAAQDAAEAAQKSADDAQATADTKVTKVAGAVGDLVVFAANGEIADSGKAIAGTVTGSANVVTDAAVKTYVEGEVATLNDKLDALDINKFQLVENFDGAAENDKLYFTANGQAKIYDGDAWYSLSMEASTNLATDAPETKVATAKAIKDYVDGQTTDVKAKAVEMLEQDYQIGDTQTATVPGRVIAVYDADGDQCYPNIAYADGSSVISIEGLTAAETFTVIYAKRINANNGALA